MIKKRPLDIIKSKERVNTLLRSTKIKELRKRLGTYIILPLNANILIQ